MTTKIYDNGLTLVVDSNPGLRSVTAGIMVGAGSAYETPANNGISHFIEHMQFKGTHKRSAEEIARAFDAAGASSNAFTGKEYTCYYFKSIDEKARECFDVLADLFIHSMFDKTELDRERKVIIEEINMSRDEPDGVCYDLLYRTVYSGSLGMEIIGTKENVSRFSLSDISEYKQSAYVPANTVVAFVGNITVAQAEGLVEEYLGELVAAEYKPSPTYEKQIFVSNNATYIHDYEQSEISIAYPGLKVGDDDTAVESALDCILGTGMSSRLFQRIREKMGLCYSVYTSPRMGKTCGEFTVCANVNAPNAKACIDAINDEIARIARDGVTQEETDKAKMQLKVTALFGKENPMNYMLSLLRRRTLVQEDYDLDKLLSRIERVTRDDINEMARRIFGGTPATVYVGKQTKLDF
ncbi:MAG: insulinase family protein [Clostridiales bacterium]|nr:insulinase family protein [Clostridiales bacterium]